MTEPVVPFRKPTVYFGLALVGFAFLAFLLWQSSGSSAKFAMKEALIGVLAAMIVVLVDRGLAVKHTRSVLKEAILEALPINDAARDCGLAHIYLDDKDAERDIVEAVANAQSRLLMLVQVGTHPVPAQAILTELTRSPLGNLPAHALHDIRLLFAHPLRSPHVLRAALANKPDEIRRMLEICRLLQKDEVGHQEQIDLGIERMLNLWRHFAVAQWFLSTFEGNGPFVRFADRVKYYATDSHVWMLVVDDTLFVKPMTFSMTSLAGANPGHSHAAGVPMMRFEGSLSRQVVEEYIRHFDTQWTISTDDWHWLRLKFRNNAHELLKRVLKHRAAWLRHAFAGSLHLRSTERQHFRKSYPEADRPDVFLVGGGVKQPVPAKAIDTSPFGLCVEIEAKPEPWQKGVTVWLDKHKSVHPEAKKMMQAGKLLDIRGLKIVAIEPVQGQPGRWRLRMQTVFDRTGPNAPAADAQST